MEKKDVRREDVIEALKEIAFGRVNRGVELTYLSEPTAQLIRKMDLSAVAEFKRNGNGTVEVTANGSVLVSDPMAASPATGTVCRPAHHCASPASSSSEPT